MSPLMYGAIKTSVVVLVGIAATVVLRRQSAAVRHWVLSVAIVCAAVMPLLSLVVPSWQLTAGASPPAPATTRSNNDPTVQVDPLAAVVVDSELPGQRAKSESSVDPRVWLGVIWISGMTVSLGILLVGVLRLRSLASRARRIDCGKWTELAEVVARAYGLGRRIRFLETEHPTLLVTWGILRPKVMMPIAAANWSEDRIRVVLSHELAHVRRADWVVQMVAELLRAVYWFNPLLWIACRRLRQESERACDDAVLDTGVAGRDYAAHLVDLARAFSEHRRMWLPAPAITGSSNLERRITAMLNVSLNRRPLTRSARVAAAIALVSVALPVAGFGAQTFATLSGTVVDQTGAILPDTTVTIVHVQSQAKHEVPTNATGYFQFVGLPAGDYRMKVQATGFAPLQDAEKALTLAAGQTVQRNIVLRVGSLQETITVTDATSADFVAHDADAVAKTRRDELDRLRANADSTRRAKLDARLDRPRFYNACDASAIGGRIVPPTKIYDVKPHFPESSHGTVGRVVFEARIGTEGTIKELRAVSPVDGDFENAARTAVSQWKFTPTLLNCVPIEVNLNVLVNFSHQ